MQQSTLTRYIIYMHRSTQCLPIILSPEGLYAHSFGNIPHADRPILGVRNNKLIFRMENYTGDIVRVPSKGINLPCLGFCWFCIFRKENIQSMVVNGCERKGS